jgi:hypothetical protein
LVEVVQAIQEASLEVTFFNCVFCMPFVVYCFFQVAFEHFAACRISTFYKCFQKMGFFTRWCNSILGCIACSTWWFPPTSWNQVCHNGQLL